jgi:calcineurin-like phosphoesterase family protein
MKIWLISDTHFYHKNIIKFENRPLDHNEKIIENWNKVVSDDDLVIHLGDVIFGMDKFETLKKVLGSLNGKKVLCRGNHDGYPESSWGKWDWFMDAGFDAVMDYFVYQDMAFSHAPLTPLPLTARYGYGKPVRLNIHGHFHRGHTRVPQTGEDEAGFQDEFYDYQYYRANKEKYRLIQIEDELRPFSLEEILEKEVI